MTIHVVSGSDEFQRLEAQWTRLHERARGTIFQSFVWNRTWWSIYGSGHELRIILALHGDDVVGILPLFREQTGFGPLRLTRLRFLGTRYIYGEYAPLILPSLLQEVTEAFGTYCTNEVTSRRVDVLELYRLPMDRPSTEMLFTALCRPGVRTRYKPNVIPRAVMSMPPSWDAYLDRLAPIERTMLRRRQKSLKKAGVELEVVDDYDECEDAFDAFVSLHRASWHPRGFEGYFEGLEGFERFHRKVTCNAMRQRAARLYFLRHDGRRFAAVQAFAVHDQCCFYLSGLDREHPLVRYSPGKVLLAEVIRDAIREGRREFDFQGGDEEYKYRLGGDPTWFSRITVRRSGPGGIPAGIFLVIQLVRNFTLNAVIEERLMPLLRRVFVRPWRG
jgi:CelD/BcsL family acetyltransferase involved in cellulose biosynthesis